MPRTVEDLLTAPMDSLTTEEISRRSAIVNMMKAERELEVVQEQNRRFQDEKDSRERIARSKTESIKAEQEENERIRRLCKHKTGGKDKAGFFNGDGDIYGYAVSKQQLPTGEIYGLCFRCQREWHGPNCMCLGQPTARPKRQVIDGKLSLIDYVKLEKAYAEMLAWPCKTFETDTGELPGGRMFMIPKLMQMQQEDDRDFSAYLAKLPKDALQMAGLGLSAK